MPARASPTGPSNWTAGSRASAFKRGRRSTRRRSLRVGSVALLAVVATLCAWLSIESIRAYRQRAAVRVIWDLGGYVGRYYERPELATAVPRWYRALFGDDFMDPVIAVRLAGTEAGDEDLVHVGKLPHLRMLDLRDTRVSDAGVRRLGGLNRLKALILTGTAVSDQGLAPLKDMPQIMVLGLEETKITDEGLRYLQGLPNLVWLNLSGTRVTDAGLRHLKECRRLEVLILEGCATSDEAVSELQRDSPSMLVYDGSIRRPGLSDFLSEQIQQ